MNKETRIFVGAADGELDNHIHKSQDDHPAVYVGTYAKYNDGSLNGAWIDLTTFDSYDEFRDWCINVLHGDEDDPELMFQDYENFPSAYYGESGLNEELWDYIEAIKDHDKDMVDAVIEDGYSLSDLDDAYVYPDCDSMEDVAYQICDELGFDAFRKETWESVFDYSHFGRELQWDMDEEELKEYEGMSDAEIGEKYVDEIGGLEELGEETIKDYADMEELGRLIEMDGDWVKYDGGYVQIVR